MSPIHSPTRLAAAPGSLLVDAARARVGRAARAAFRPPGTARTVGYLPPPGSINTEGLDVSEEDMAVLEEFDPELVKAELPSIHEHYAKFGEALPQELRDQLKKLEQALGA